jgi:hypothetical protein
MDGTFHKWHIDCDGFGTYIDTQAGKKWWAVAQPWEASGFASMLFFSEKFNLDSENTDLCITKAILLTPGTQL